MANEKRLIDANMLTDVVDYSKYNNPHTNGRVKINHYNEHDHFLRMIFEAPTVDAVELVHGHWVSLTECSNAGVYCSVCNKKVYKEDYAWCNRKNKLRSNYCPNCGAKMDGGNEDG